MAISINEIGGLLARFGNEIVNEQSNMACPFVGNGHIQKVKHAHEQGVVRIREGDGLSSTGQLADGSALPEGSNVSFQAGTYLPKIFFTRLSIPRGAAHLAAGGRDGVRLVREELEVAGRQLGKVLGQAVFRAPYADMLHAVPPAGPGPGPDIDVGPGTVTWGGGPINPGDTVAEQVFLSSIAGLYVGQYVMIRDDITGTLYSVKVLELNHNMDEIPGGPGAIPVTYADPASTGFGCFWAVFEFTNTTAAPITLQVSNAGILNNELVLGGDSSVMLQNRNQENQNPPATLFDPDPMVSLGDAYGLDPLYGGLLNGAYTGNRKAVNGPLTAKAMRDMSTIIKRRAGYGWHMLVMNSNNLQSYFETTIAPSAALNYLPGQTTKDADGGATVPMFQGLPIIVDENVPDHVMYFFNKDDVKLAEFKSFGPDQDGSNAHGMVDRSKLIYDTQIWGMYNMRVQRRNSGGQLTGLQQNL